MAHGSEVEAQVPHSCQGAFLPHLLPTPVTAAGAGRLSQGSQARPGLRGGSPRAFISPARDSDVRDCRLHRAQLEHDPGSGDLLLCSPPPQPRRSPDPQLPGHPRGCPLPSSNTSMWAARPHEPTVFRETTCWRGLQCLNQNAPCALIPQTCSEIGALNKAEPVTVR